MINCNRKKGTIGITIVMLVFGLLMAVAMSYHKTLQTETMVQNNSNYSERAMDAAFSGVNYAMALLQSKKSVFSGTNVYLVKKGDVGENKIEMDWISLNQKFDNYFDEDRYTSTNTDICRDKIPPYRFIVSCSKEADGSNKSNYSLDGSDKIIYIKSKGQYIKYEDEDLDSSTPREDIDKIYEAQIIAKCIMKNSSKTIVLKSYKRVPLDGLNDNGYPKNVFFTLNDEDINKF